LANESDFQKCKEARKAEIDKYYQTVLLTLGFKDLLEAKKGNCSFVSAEPRFFVENTRQELKPDMVLQYEPSRGVLCETKTSLPFPDVYLLSSLDQIEKYSKEVTGWNTPDRRVANHDILFLCHSMDSDRVVGKIQEWLEDGTLKVTKKLSICEWSMIISPKTGKDVILIRHRLGTTDCEELNQMLRANVVIDTQAISVKYEKCKFTRKEPPVEYLMQEFWVNVFSELNVKLEDFETSLTDILKIAYEYYIPWSNIEGEYSQVRQSWVSKALNAFAEIGLAEEISVNGSKYRILRTKKLPKDILDYFIEARCRLLTRQPQKTFTTDEQKAESQRSLEEFGVNEK